MQDTTEQLQHPQADDAERLHFSWAFLYIASALCELGLTPALRGSWTGMDASIDGLARVGGALAQTTGVLSGLAIIRTTLASMSTGSHLLASLLRGLLSTLPIIALMIAHTDALPAVVILGASAACAWIWLSVALEWSRARQRGAGWIWLWCAAFLAKVGAATLGTLGPAGPWALACAGLASALALATSGVVFLGAARATRHGPASAALLLGVALLLAQTAGAAADPDCPRVVLLLGRTLNALGQAPADRFALSLLLASAALFVALRSTRGVPLAALGLSLFLPLSPLSCAAFTLGGLQLALWGQRYGGDHASSSATRR